MSSLLTQLVKLLAPKAPAAVIAAAVRVVVSLVEMAREPGRDRDRDVRVMLDDLMEGLPEWGDLSAQKRDVICAGLVGLVDFLADVYEEDNRAVRRMAKG